MIFFSTGIKITDNKIRFYAKSVCMRKSAVAKNKKIIFTTN